MNEYSDFASDDLLVIIGMRKDAPKDAEMAFTELHARFHEYAWNFTYTLVGKNKRLSAEEICSDTLYRVYEKATEFKLPQNADPDTQVKKWIAGIGKNEFKRHLRESYKGPDLIKLDTLPDEGHYLSEEAQEDGYSIQAKALDAALDTVLSDRDRDILLILLHFEEHGMDPEIRQGLCNQYRIGKDTLRQIKLRAIEKLKKYLVFDKSAKRRTAAL